MECRICPSLGFKEAYSDQALEGQRVDAGERLLLGRHGVAVETIAESLEEVGALHVAVVLGVNPLRDPHVRVEIDHHGRLLAEIQQAFQGHFLGEEVVRHRGLSMREIAAGEGRVGEANVDGGDEDFELDFEEGFEGLEEVEDDAERERERLGVFGARVLDEILAEHALKKGNEGLVRGEKVAVHLEERVDHRQSIVQTRDMHAIRHPTYQKSLRGVR